MEARAIARNLRMSARKVRLVVDLIRGKSVGEAYSILQFSPKAAAEPVSKTLRSAVANATVRAQGEGQVLDVDDLFVREVRVTDDRAPEDLVLRVLEGERLLVEHRPRRRPVGPAPEPAREPLPPERVRTVEELYLGHRFSGIRSPVGNFPAQNLFDLAIQRYARRGVELAICHESSVLHVGPPGSALQAVNHGTGRARDDKKPATPSGWPVFSSHFGTSTSSLGARGGI